MKNIKLTFRYLYDIIKANKHEKLMERKDVILMNLKIKKLSAFVGACAVAASLCSNAFAAEFIDMPDNWTTSALENASKNGLLYGEEAEGGMKINPDANITRAQMAAIIVRAFGATETTDISKYTDADPDAWYYTELSKAVAMGAFRGDGNSITPEDNITFQQCFTVVSQVLQMDLFPEMYTKDLSSFTDADEVAEWALPYVKAVVGMGYWDGIDSKLLPTEYITRSQFAVLMDNIVKTYITEPGEYTDLPEGNVMIRSNDVVIANADIKGCLIIGDGVSKESNINNSKVSELLISRGSSDLYLNEGTSVFKTLLVTPNQDVYIDATSESVNGGWACYPETCTVHMPLPM